MIRKTNMKKLFIAIFLVSIILTIPFTTITSSSVITTSKKENQKKLDNIEIDNNEGTAKVEQHIPIFEKNKDDLKKSFTQLRILINVIKLHFKNHPEIVSLCQQVLTKLNVLFRDWPAFMCLILLEIFWILDEIRYIIIYDLGFPILGELLSVNLLFLEVIFMIRCSWMFPDGSKSTYGIANISEALQLSKVNPCPCMHQEY